MKEKDLSHIIVEKELTETDASSIDDDVDIIVSTWLFIEEIRISFDLYSLIISFVNLLIVIEFITLSTSEIVSLNSEAIFVDWLADSEKEEKLAIDFLKFCSNCLLSMFI